jgi:hypothetical protein
LEVFSQILGFVVVAVEGKVPGGNLLLGKEYLIEKSVGFGEGRSLLGKGILFRSDSYNRFLLVVLLEIMDLAFGRGGQLFYLFLDLFAYIQIAIKIFLVLVELRGVAAEAGKGVVEVED